MEIILEIEDLLDRQKCDRCFSVEKGDKIIIRCDNIEGARYCGCNNGIFTQMTWLLFSNNIDYTVTPDYSIVLN